MTGWKKTQTGIVPDIMSTLPKFGYVETHNHPFKVGQKVRIRKGAKIGSTAPSGSRTQGRSQTVEIQILNCGRSVCVGYQIDEKDEPKLRYHTKIWDSVEKIYGTSDLETLYLQGHITRLDNGDLILKLEDPGVQWAGAGGYWCWTDIENVELCS